MPCGTSSILPGCNTDDSFECFAKGGIGIVADGLCHLEQLFVRFLQQRSIRSKITVHARLVPALWWPGQEIVVATVRANLSFYLDGVSLSVLR
jgi:hypothetical protein